MNNNYNITIIDYGMGNLHSVAKALEKVGGNVTISSTKNDIVQADKLVLPGVGSFGDCMLNLQKYDLIETIKNSLASEKPFLGICLGMQLLFESSEESPQVKGLGVFKGKVVKIIAPKLKVPHIGWNNLKLAKPSPILANSENDYVYFVHSYYVVPRDAKLITSFVEYGGKITASIGKNHIQAVQFHPEKSSVAGLKILKNFVNL